MAIFDQEHPGQPISAAARCSFCNANFPIELAGAECPICQIDTLDGIRDIAPDDEDELMHRINEAEFVRYYERTRGCHPDAERLPEELPDLRETADA